MSTIGGTASNNEMQHKSFLTPATRNNAILDYGSVASDVVEIEGGTADEAFQNLLDVVAAPSPNNPFNTGDTNQSPSSTVNLLNGLKVYKVTSTAGHVLQAEITSAGTGYSETGSGVATSYGGAGTGCQVQVISVGDSVPHVGKVTGVKITANGSGYSDGDVLTISGGGGNATITIKTVAYFRTLLYVQESHGVSSFTSTVAELKAQGLSYSGSQVTSVSNGETDYSNIGVTLPNIFDEPLTVVSKPTATSHRVIVGQARNPHATIAGRRQSSGGGFPNPFGLLSGLNGIIYSAIDIVCQNADNALEVGEQITFPAHIRGTPSDNPAFFSFGHVLDEDHIVMFTNLKAATNADLSQPAVPTFLSSASDRFFLGLGFENGDPTGTDQFASPVIVNPQFLQILGTEYTNGGTLVIPTHVKRIALYPKDHDAFLRRGVYHSDESLTGPDFDGEVISGTISTAGSGYGTNTGVSFTTSGGSGRGSGFTFTTNTNGGVINTNFTITTNPATAVNKYLPGEILDVVGGAGTGAKVTVTTRGNSTLPFVLLPAGKTTEIVVDTGKDCALTLVSTGTNDIVYVQYLTG